MKGCEYFKVEVGDGLENLAVHLVNVLCGLSSFQPLGQTFFATQFHLDVQVLVVVPGQCAVGCGQLDGQRRGIAAAVPVGSQVAEDGSERRRRRFKCVGHFSVCCRRLTEFAFTVMAVRLLMG